MRTGGPNAGHTTSAWRPAARMGTHVSGAALAWAFRKLLQPAAFVSREMLAAEIAAAAEFRLAAARAGGPPRGRGAAALTCRRGRGPTEQPAGSVCQWDWRLYGCADFRAALTPAQRRAISASGPAGVELLDTANHSGQVAQAREYRGLAGTQGWWLSCVSRTFTHHATSRDTRPAGISAWRPASSLGPISRLVGCLRTGRFRGSRQ